MQQQRNMGSTKVTAAWHSVRSSRACAAWTFRRAASTQTQQKKATNAVPRTPITTWRLWASDENLGRWAIDAEVEASCGCCSSRDSLELEAGGGGGCTVDGVASSG